MAVSEIIVSYIMANRSKGKKDATIISELKKAGWSQDYIDAALNIVNKQKSSGTKILTYTTAVIATVLVIGGGFFYAINNRDKILINASVEDANQITTSAARTVTGQVTLPDHLSILSASSQVDGPVIVNDDGTFTIGVLADKPDMITIYNISDGEITTSTVTIPGHNHYRIDTASTAVAVVFSEYDQATIESIGASQLYDKILAANCTSNIISRFNKNLASISLSQILSDVLIQGQIEDCANRVLSD